MQATPEPRDVRMRYINRHFCSDSFPFHLENWEENDFGTEIPKKLYKAQNDATDGIGFIDGMTRWTKPSVSPRGIEAVRIGGGAALRAPFFFLTSGDQSAGVAGKKADRLFGANSTRTVPAASEADARIPPTRCSATRCQLLIIQYRHSHASPQSSSFSFFFFSINAFFFCQSSFFFSGAKKYLKSSLERFKIKIRNNNRVKKNWSKIESKFEKAKNTWKKKRSRQGDIRALFGYYRSLSFRYKCRKPKTTAVSFECLPLPGASIPLARIWSPKI